LSKLPFTPKRRRFGVGWLKPPLAQKWGGRTTPFLAKGWLNQPYGGGRSRPRPLGVFWPPRKAKKKKKGKMGFGLWGWPNHPQGPGDGFGHPLRPVGGVPKSPPGPRGWFGHPQRPKPIFPFFFFFFWPYRVAGPPPKAWGGFGHPHTAGSVTPWPKMGWSGHPISGQGVAPATPRDSPFFFFFFFFFNSFFFSKKKKKILKFTKPHRFAQNGVVLDKPKTA
jgi:hypothetical protein